MISKSKKNHLIALVLSMLLVFSVSAPAMAADTTAINNISYLRDVYSVKLYITNVADYKSVLKAVLKDESLKATSADKKHKLAVATAVDIAIDAAKMKELAQTYSLEKVKRTFNENNLTYSSKSKAFTFAQAQKIALALELNLLDHSSKAKVRSNGTLNPTEAANLIAGVLNCQGKYENYLGRTVDTGILGKVQNEITLAKKVTAPKLTVTLDKAVESGITTGYNVRDTRNYSNFAPSLTLRYGHDNSIHAAQLVALLKSEDIDAKVNVETKTSAYVYLKEWGITGLDEKVELTPKQDGNYIAHSQEYDLMIEFANLKAKNKFQDVVYKYAKVDKDNQTGLIYQAWWQPLYVSSIEMPKFTKITDIVITSGNYEAHVYSLDQDVAKKVAGLKKIDSTLSIKTMKIWVDNPFYNYLKGDYK